MILVVDIGNTNVVVGVFQGVSLLFSFRMATDVRRTRDEYESMLLAILRERVGDTLSIRRTIVSSVVPPITERFVSILKSLVSEEPVVVGPGVRTGLHVKTKNPAAVGADRIVNGVAAKALFGVPALVIDFGTATSFDVIDADSSYCGGAIAAGLEISLDALVSRTAKLPKIEIEWPSSAVGTDTVEAMQVGTVLGYHCLVEGLITHMIRQHGEFKHIIATGGLGRIFAEKSEQISRYEPDLTLQGLRILAEQN